MITSIHPVDVLQAIEEGLFKTPKRLPSWLFYDEKGDKIFQSIMRMPEYYLTGCEYEIFQMHKEQWRTHFVGDGSHFNIVELGAGDGMKTEILLRHFAEKRTRFNYSPVDVSSDALRHLENRLKRNIQNLSIHPVHKKYYEVLSDLHYDTGRKVLLFLGANIGNFPISEARHFMKQISRAMHERDQLLIGFDLKKDPRIIQAAYDDPHGITRDFNLNLLVRLNREAGAQFDISQFKHYPYYDPETGLTKSYLVSMQDQEVYIEGTDQTIYFDKWEVIHTEVSQKYDLAMIEELAEKAGLQIVDFYHDRKQYFCDVLFIK